MTPQERAEKSAAAMWVQDGASKWLGLSLDHVAPGAAVMSLEIGSQHLNGHGMCHGGVIYTLADSAFAFACNSYNRQVLSQHNSITYLSPGQNGERLTATAREVDVTGRTGIYDVSVTAPDGRVVAEFRGGSRQIKGQHFEETP